MTRFPTLHILANILRPLAFQFAMKSPKFQKSPISNLRSMSACFCEKGFSNSKFQIVTEAVQSELLTGNARHWWIGLTDEASEGRWYWSYSLKIADYFPWGVWQPDGGIEADFVCLYSGFTYAWSDETPTFSAYPVCQFI